MRGVRFAGLRRRLCRSDVNCSLLAKRHQRTLVAAQNWHLADHSFFAAQQSGIGHPRI